AAVALVTHREATEPGVGTLLPLGLVVGILAGVWQRTLFIRVPGGTKIGLAFFLALDLALFLLLVARPLPSFDVGFGLSRRTVALAVAAAGVVALVGLPIGFAIGFVKWNWRWLGWSYAAVRLFGLILFVGLPEVMLVRGLILEGLTRAWNPRWGWLVASVLFGLAHITKAAPPLNWRYALLATLAGLGYGWVYARTGKLAAAAVTHGSADWLWGTFFHS
ncbi:MAG: CPBP family intramembrane metalloprotease, partial [Gemmatimonadales bacterium]|nr:CPBP family intramembrane metalloprotease [Gemmatimonadales bacterium]